VSNDTLLRAVRRCGTPRAVPPTVIGIDDWAWRRNQRYETIVCDLERRKTSALLPDREPATAEAWLQGQRQIAVVARDRGGRYGLAIAIALPQATQVADRWHLMENASGAFLDAVRKSMRQIRGAINAATINPELLTAAEQLQYEGYLRREETDGVILEVASKGVAIKEIVRPDGHSRGLVRRVLHGQRSDVFRVRGVHLSSTCHGWRNIRRPVDGTVLHFGGSSRAKASVAACASSTNGRHVVAGPSRRTAD
jgi:transposase